MFNFLASCGLCSDRPTPGDYAYEAYPKLSPSAPSNQVRGSKVEGVNEEWIHSQPKSSVVAGDYTFRDLTNDNPREVYIRKIMKSDYTELIHKYQESGQNFTDREF